MGKLRVPIDWSRSRAFTVPLASLRIDELGVDWPVRAPRKLMDEAVIRVRRYAEDPVLFERNTEALSDLDLPRAF